MRLPYHPTPVLVLLLAGIGLIACAALPPAAPPSQAAIDRGFLNGAMIRMLIVGDPFSIALLDQADELGDLAGGTLVIEVVPYDDLRLLTLRNAEDQESAYDIISFDVVWAGEYGQAEVLLPLDDLIIATPTLQPADFLTLAYTSSQFQGRQLGLPIQPHPELLWYRRDRFAAEGMLPPRTTDELLAAARRLTRPEADEYGLCWNGQRGQALGQQIAHFYAAFGQPLLDAAGRPTLNTPQGIAAARFARDLLAVSPPDVLNMAWDQRPRRFGQGGCLMTYEWAARSYLVEDDPTSNVRGQVGYLPAPHAPGAAPVTPLGTWSLGIPANIGERRELAWRFLAWLSSPAIQQLLAEHGNGGMPRKSLLQNPALAKRYPAFATVATLDAESRLADWMRPAIPQWSALAEILGTVYHDMLRGELTPEQAADLAQQQAEALLRVKGKR
jgi:multiple sugar transport system substrate-binding protein